ncbi:Asp23/Gls24 family envelope stress response protein [Streptomyces sp. NBC_00306]|uniref:Asp23/Gls24 family envelope stress response protein n=1 Tax=Streptomyces sp. NBC_00306 TaxID=2975708 RepID=UPI002E2BAE5B|nr:Asp23/Gls24 family envelope stress response protein [Streptomyces sp. NBC_00306]
MTQNPHAPHEQDGPGREETRDVDLLPCGRDLFRTVEQGQSEQSDAHARSCPYCAAVLGETALLNEVVRRAGDGGSAGGDADAGDDTDRNARIMDVVRLELSPGRNLPLGGRDEDTWITEAATARTFRAAAASLTGVHIGDCVIRPLDAADPGPARWPRGPVHVRLDAVVARTWDLQDVAARIRERITSAADTELGMDVAVIDVRIADILDPEAGDEGGER